MTPLFIFVWLRWLMYIQSNMCLIEIIIYRTKASSPEIFYLFLWYVDHITKAADSRILIHESAAFLIRSMYHRNKENISGQLASIRYMILSIKHILDWIYISQRNQAKINKGFIWKNSTIIDYDYRVVDRVFLRNK